MLLKIIYLLKYFSELVTDINNTLKNNIFIEVFQLINY